MPKLSLFVRLEAKPGKEADVAAFLNQGLELARQEVHQWRRLQPCVRIDAISHG